MTEYAISNTDYESLVIQREMQVACQKTIEQIRERYCANKPDRAKAEEKFDRIMDGIDEIVWKAMS